MSLSLVDGVLDFGEAGCVAVSDAQELLHDIQHYLRSESSPIEAQTFLESTVLLVFEWEKSVALPILSGCTNPEGESANLACKSTHRPPDLFGKSTTLLRALFTPFVFRRSLSLVREGVAAGTRWRAHGAGATWGRC